MRVAVCDDDKKDAGKIEFALLDIGGCLELDIFSDGKDFLEKVRAGALYDLVFMDIFIGEENGVDIVRNMQEISPSTQVIFSTVSREFAVEAFDVNAVGYLVKPYSEADILKVFARAGLRRKYTDETVLLRCGLDRQLFHVSEVVKIESDAHYTKITVSSGNVSRYHLSFSEVSALFVNGFLEIKRGISVNMAYIERIKASVVYLKDGSNYKIARGKKDYIVNQYTAFVIKNDGRN